MTQTAKVKKVLSSGLAEVAVKRVSACAHDCSKCASGGCQMMDHPDLTVKAYNHPGAKEGDFVLVETSSKTILSLAAVVYLVPFVGLILGYFLGAQVGLGEGGSILLGGALFGLSILGSVALNKRVGKNAVQFSITRVLN